MIYLIADLHGSAKELTVRIPTEKLVSLNAKDVVVVLGDAGLHYDGYEAYLLKLLMSKAACSWVVIRGNHDARYWKEFAGVAKKIKKFGTTLLQDIDFCNIMYVEDGGDILEIAGKTFACIPGGYSVDKYIRLARNLPYTDDELLNEGEKVALRELIKKQQKIDYVLSHVAPSHLLPELEYLFLQGIDQSQVDSSQEAWLDEIAAENEFDRWYFGHYHGEKTMKVNDKQYEMLFRNVVELKG